MDRDLELEPIGARRRRPLLVSLTAAAVALGLVGLAGVFAVATDTATTGENRYETDEFPERPDAELQIATASEGGTCGEFVDDLTTGLIDFEEDLEGGGASPVEQWFCLRNLGQMPLAITATATDVVDLDTLCTSREAEADSTCGADQAGELASYLQVALDPSCEGAGAAGSLSDFDGVAQPFVELAPDDTLAFCLRASTPGPTRATQSDTVTWRFAFEGSTPDDCLDRDAEPNGAIFQAVSASGGVGTLCTSDDRDVFRFQHPGGPLGAHVRHDADAGPVTARLLDPAGNYVVDLEEVDGTVPEGETGLMAFEMTPFSGESYPAGTYLLVVEGFWDGTTIPGTEYEFEVGAAEGCSSDEPFHQPLTFQAPPVSGVLCRFDVDRYLLTQPATGSFEVRLDFDPAEGNLELVLTDVGGTVIGRSQGTGPSESIQVEDAPAGSYVAHVVGHHGAGNSYSIEWR